MIDPYKVRALIVGSSTFGFAQAVPYTRSSEPIPIEVMPLPKENQPSDFSGAVGSFRVSSFLDENQVRVNQPVTLKIRFFGQGNAKLIDLPPLSFPPQLEIYDTKKESVFFKDGKSKREFTMLIIPRSEGLFVIPAINISAFDPERGEYYAINTQAHGLTVRTQEGDSSIISSSPLEKLDKRDEPQLPHVMASWKSIKGKPDFSALFWVLVYLYVLSFLIWRFIVEFGLAKKKKDWHQLIRSQARQVEHLIAKGEWRRVGSSVTNLVCRALGEVSGLGGASFELDKLILESPPSVRREVGDRIKLQYKFFEVLSFAPEEMLERLKDKESLVAQLLEIEKNLLKVIELGLVSGRSRVHRG